MSSNHNNNNHHHHRSHHSNKSSETSLFETYRQIAPETLDDDSLRNIIKTNLNKHDAIIGAIENIWHDTPDQKAVGQDWVTTGIPKAKKQEPSKVSSGTGRIGGGKDKNSLGGKGSIDGGRTERGPPRSTSTKREQTQLNIPSVVVPVSKMTEKIVSSQPTSSSQATAVESSSGNVASFEGTKAAIIWGQGLSLAEKLKKAEAEKENLDVKDKNENDNRTSEIPPSQPDAPTIDNRKSNARKNKHKSRGNKRAGQEDAVPEVELSESISNINLSSDVSTVEVTVVSTETLSNNNDISVQVINTQSEVNIGNDCDNNNVQGSFLKMGKWESSVDTTDESTFKFGSFGSFNDNEPVINPVTKSVWPEKNSSSSVWNNNASSLDGVSNVSSVSKPGVSSMGSLFTSANATTSSTNTSSTTGPPGLVQNSQINNSNKSNINTSNIHSTKQSQPPMQNKSKNDMGQPAQQVPQSVLYQPYNQQMLPPGIPPGINNRNMGINPLPNIPPYSYAGGPFDLSQAQFPSYMPAGITVPPPALSAATPITTAHTQQSSSSTSTTPVTTITSNTPQQTPSQQQYAPAAPFPYYPNPYYTSQAAAAYYYGQPQLSNYYNGRGMYQQQQQQRVAYGNADPYGNATGMQYPSDLYQQQQQVGQFPESANIGSSNTNVSGKSAKGTNSVSVSQQQQQQQQVQGISQDHHLNSNYGAYVNPYNGRGNMDAQAWQYSQNQAAGWAPMMNFPTTGTSAAVPQGFTQQGMGITSQQQAISQQVPQSHNNNNNSRTTTNSGGYANTAFGSRVSNSSVPSTNNGPNAQVNW